MHRFEKQVLEFIRSYGLVFRDDKLVVAVSGGADSICLLQILHNVSSHLGISLFIAHLDHGIRGQASHEDAEYVSKIAKTLSLPATIEKRDVPGYRKQHRISIEEAAREVRYQFLEDVLKSQEANAVAVAHTMNDHIETVLLHVLRGSGLRGLVGLRGKSKLSYKRVGPLPIIRPLLCLNREEVETYCREQGLEYRTDATNESVSQTRNRIRLKLLPKLRQDYNPRIDDALARLSRLAADDVDFIDQEAQNAISKIMRFENGVTLIDKTAFRELNPSLRRTVLIKVLAAAAGSPKDIETVHIEKMIEMSVGDAGSTIDLLDGLKFAVGYRDLMLGRDLAKLIPLPELDGQHSLDILGVTEIPGWRITATIADYVSTIPPGKSGTPLVQAMDLDISGGHLTVRTRRPGDTFQPLGMEVEKSIKDFYIDAKVPRLWRSRVPVVVNPSQVVWVVGHRLDDRVKITDSTRRILKLEFERQLIMPLV